MAFNVSTRSVASVALGLAIPCLPQPAWAAAEAQVPATCASLSKAAMPDRTTVIMEAAARNASAAEVRAAGDPRPFPPAPAMPAHCEIIGKMQERAGAKGQVYAIKFHVRLPVTWNGRFVFQGGGGTDGNLGDATAPLLGQPGVTALGQGYAVVSSDSGHDCSPSAPVAQI